MRRFSVIGTAHRDDVDLVRALESALDRAAPDQLILEMPDEAALAGRVKNQKPEMAAAYRWAARHGVPVRGHEPPGLGVLRDGLSPQRIGGLAQQMDALVSGLTVRRTIDIFCQRATARTDAERRLSAVIETLIDPEKALVRTRGIISAIGRVAAPEGHVLILCGGAHVPLIVQTLEGCEIIGGEHFY